jgi:hypothetical protein
VAWRGGNLIVVTWGKTQIVTPQFLSTYVDEAWAVVSPEFLVAGKSPDGFDLPTLLEDLSAIQQ